MMSMVFRYERCGFGEANRHDAQLIVVSLHLDSFPPP